MKALWTLGLCLLAASPAALAQSPPTLDPSFCQKLVAHTPDADVAYRPGLDVHGRPVAGADVEEDRAPLLPETVTIPLTADLAHFLNLPSPALQGTEIQLGTLTLRQNKVYWNGQPLGASQQENLAVLCLKPTR